MSKKDDNGLKKWVVFSGIAIQMGIVIAAGAFLGVYLDEKIPNEYSAFTIICSLSGVFLALYWIIKQLQKFNTDDE